MLNLLDRTQQGVRNLFRTSSGAGKMPEVGDQVITVEGSPIADTAFPEIILAGHADIVPSKPYPQ